MAEGEREPAESEAQGRWESVGPPSDGAAEPDAAAEQPDAPAEEAPEAAETPAPEVAEAPAEEPAEPVAEDPAEIAPPAAEPVVEAPEPEAVPAPAPAPSGPDIAEVRRWDGFKLDELNGANVAKIEGAYVDEADGRPTWLLVRLGRFGHHTLVPARDAVAAGSRVWVPYDREAIRRAPRLKPGVALNREQETTLLDHYRITGAAGRAGEIAGREADAITTRPAS
jgi:hypothetical protein